MTKGLGVTLQKYPDGGAKLGLRQAVVFSAEEGLLWPGAVRVRSFAELEPWVGKRAATGKAAPPWATKKA